MSSSSAAPPPVEMREKWRAGSVAINSSTKPVVSPPQIMEVILGCSPRNLAMTVEEVE